jgi:OPA family glycerol-3-phosphate transporter-like MFS transporter/OPA family sugar phosphate sensor protein UhpC-like MFS transporter
MSEEAARKFKYWQIRTIIGTMVGYAAFYFVRKNLSIAIPAILDDPGLGFSKAELGLILTLMGVCYGISRFVNGMVGDRVISKYFMAGGLILSAICNIIFGLSSSLIVFTIVWIFNGWFQGTGFPPCVRLLTHWVPPKQLATKMSIWNTSHSIGAGLVLVVCGYIISSGLGWRWCFYIPSAVALAGAAFILISLRDTPKSVGLEELNIEQKKKEDKNDDFKKILRKRVFANPYIWIIGIANFFVYVLRYAILDWGPTLLGEWKGISINKAGWMVALFELAGVFGMLTAGRVTDKFFGGRGPRVCVFCMLLATMFMALFWVLDSPPIWLATLILACAGFFIYGPQALVGIAAANIATQEAAASAAGLTGLFGYASTIFSGWGLGYIAEHMGWSFAFASLMAFGIVGALVFMMSWKAKANGYDEDKTLEKA